MCAEELGSARLCRKPPVLAILGKGASPWKIALELINEKGLLMAAAEKIFYFIFFAVWDWSGVIRSGGRSPAARPGWQSAPLRQMLWRMGRNFMAVFLLSSFFFCLL